MVIAFKYLPPSVEGGLTILLHVLPIDSRMMQMFTALSPALKRLRGIPVKRSRLRRFNPLTYSWLNIILFCWKGNDNHNSHLNSSGSPVGQLLDPGCLRNFCRQKFAQLQNIVLAMHFLTHSGQVVKPYCQREAMLPMMLPTSTQPFEGDTEIYSS